MIRKLMLGAVMALLSVSLAQAEEGLLRWDQGPAQSLESLEFDGHYVHFEKPGGWDKLFSVELSCYGQRYGDVGNTQATVTIWGPQSEKTRQLEDAAEGWVIYYRQQFPLASVPEQAGWFSLPLDTVELPDEFGVSLFTYSNEERGVKVGLTAGSMETSRSAGIAPGKMAQGEAGLEFRDDGHDWMIRIKVRSTLEPEVTITSDQLTGDKFSGHDDGSADGFVTFQRFGPLLHVKTSGPRNVKRVYVYGQVEGDWFNTTRNAAVILLDSRLKIIDRQLLGYANYTNQPAWHFVPFESVPVPAEFYVLVEPASRPKVKLLLGYDASSDNRASYFGTVGAFKNWNSEAPESSTNWMIRVEYL